MEHLTSLNIILALSGVVLHILMKVQPHLRKKTFVWGMFVKDNLLTVIMSIIATFVLVVLSEDVLQLFGIEYTEGTISVMAFTAGYLNQSLLRNVVKIITPNK
jgi:hypothetical protein